MKIGGYDVIATVGRGGMGTVLHARQLNGREVAIKVLNRDGDAARFERERRLLETLGEAEGFVPLLEAGQAEDGPFIVMPYLAGGTLRSRLHRGQLPVAATIALARKLAAALARAHAMGIVHRDLKPENVIFTARGEPLIADLGLAKHFERGLEGGSKSVSISRDGEVLGTAGYMPLEQFRDARDVGPEADVFALGAILHECLAGTPAFSGEHMVEVLAKLETGVVTSLKRVRPDAPPWFIAAVEKALARDPGKRFKDASELLAALDAGGSSERRGRGTLLLALVAALALVVVLVALTAARAPEEKPRPALPAGFEPLASARLLELQGVWGLPNGKHSQGASCVAFMPGGKTVVSGAGDNTLRFWDAETGREEATLDAHTSGVRALALTADARRALTAGGENTLIVWDLVEKRALRTIIGLRSYVEGLAITPDGKRGVSVGYDSVLTVWDLEAGIAVDRIETGQQAIHSVALTPDGTRALTAGQDKTLRLIDLGTSREVGKLEGHLEAVTAVAISSDGQRALSGSVAQAVRSWDLASMRWRWTQVQGSTVRAVAVSPDGRLGVSGGDGRTVLVWDIETSRTLHVLDLGTKGGVAALAFSADSRRLAVALRDNSIRLWELPATPAGSTRELWAPHGHRGMVMAVAVSDDGTRVVSGGFDGLLRVRHARTGEELKVLGEKGTAVASLVFSPDGKRVVAGGWDKTIRVHEVTSGREVKALVGHKGHVFGLSFLADGKRLVSASREGGLKVWDVDAGKVLRDWKTESEYSDVFSVDGARRAVFTGGPDGKIKRWDPETGSLEGSLDTGLTGFFGLAAGATGDRVLSVGHDDRVKVWAWGEKVLRCATERHQFRTFGVAVLGERRIVSVRSTGPLLLHDLETGRKLDEVPFTHRIDQPSALTATRDGRAVFVGTERGLVLRYESRAE